MTREPRLPEDGPALDVVAWASAATRLGTFSGWIDPGPPRGLDRSHPAARVSLAGTLEDLLRFGFTQPPPWELVDVIVQDEFTHDVIIQGPARAFLVFDTT
jgi:hypothetical protein